TSPLEFDARIKAVTQFLALPQARQLASANKRVSNILQKSPLTSGSAINTQLLTDPAELALAQALSAVTAKVEPWLAESNFTEALVALAELQEVVDAFFERVMVNVDDP